MTGNTRIGAPVGKSQRSHDYVKHYGGPEKWMFAAWLSLTGKGEQVARSLEQEDIARYRSTAT
jgi:hypothetical protein